MHGSNLEFKRSQSTINCRWAWNWDYSKNFQDKTSYDGCWRSLTSWKTDFCPSRGWPIPYLVEFIEITVIKVFTHFGAGDFFSPSTFSVDSDVLINHKTDFTMDNDTGVPVASKLYLASVLVISGLLLEHLNHFPVICGWHFGSDWYSETHRCSTKTKITNTLPY